MSEQKKNNTKPVLSILAVGSTAATIYEIISNAYDFLERLNENGTEAFKSFIIPGILAVISLVFALAFISSSSDSKGDQGGPAMGFLGRLARTITKACIALVIIGIVAFGAYGAILYREYTQRPVINVLDYVDLSEAINGYDGQAVFDEEKVIYKLPAEVRDVYKDSRNYDNKADYYEEQDEWYRFTSNLDYEIDIASSGLSNDDIATITARYRGKDLSALKASLHIIIKGIDSSETMKLSDIKILPQKFDDQDSASSEEGDVIRAAADRLRNDTMVRYTDVSNYQDTRVLCKPKYKTDSGDDALLVVAAYTENSEIYGERQMYRACIIYPFDSRADTDIVSGEGYWDYGAEIQFVLTDPTEDIDQIERKVISGDMFNNNVEYEMQVIE